MATMAATIITESNFMTNQLDSIVIELPKYKENLDALIFNFTIDEMLSLMNTIFRDKDFKTSEYYKLYNNYFDEIEELIHIMQKTKYAKK
jgi:hypothetical protein